MGNCINSCLPHQSSAARALRNFNILDNESTAVDFAFLVEENTSSKHEEKRSFFSRLFKKRTNKKRPVLQLVDGLRNAQVPSGYSRLSESQRLPSTGSCTSRDIQLQCLDARALLQRTATSTPASSLDLEWEHETLPASMIHDPSGSSWTALPEDISCCPTTSHTHNSEMNANASDSDWSRVSSANSLEWDNVQNSIQAEGSPPISELDTDTQFLLGEIERLTNKTLEETGKELFS
ncbi:uncharacterized protein LOC114330525 isoform X1 [Diabrotica virgifera virgifera]|uniref:Uncharacterized protein LOC114330525 isoform X1 n=1 Tax=Diabrotica virgifera virgifera TaxID=50390 RepID=A0A6P7FID8_DIAVI|nr:uncharacterized protein LOC114330525 isoform X1 [Diabrotica virgifera virgifera]